MLLGVFIVAALFLDSAEGNVCLLKCKDNYMNRMSREMREAAGEWAMEMVTPLQALLHDGQQGRLRRRLNRVCSFNHEYLQCMDACEEGAAAGREILKDGQETWRIVCGTFYNASDHDFHREILPCWEQRGQEIAFKCSRAASSLQADSNHLMSAGIESVDGNLDGFCRTASYYDQCFAARNFEYCGAAATRFIVHLTHQTSNKLIDLLDRTVKLSPLPSSCKDWMNPSAFSRKLYHRRSMGTSEWTTLSAVASVLTAYLLHNFQ